MLQMDVGKKNSRAVGDFSPTARALSEEVLYIKYNRDTRPFMIKINRPRTVCLYQSRRVTLTKRPRNLPAAFFNTRRFSAQVA